MNLLLKMLCGFAALTLSAAAFADQRVDLFQCQPAELRPGAPIYKLWSVSSQVAPFKEKFFLSKTSANPRVKEESIEVAPPQRYGKTTIMYKNAGRSGYALLYFVQDDLAVIDVNLQQAKKLNTNGPLTDYLCIAL